MARGRGGAGAGPRRGGAAGRGAGAPAPASLGAPGAPLAAPLKVLGSGRRGEGAGARVRGAGRAGGGAEGEGRERRGGRGRGRAAGRALAAASVRGAETPSAELSVTKSQWTTFPPRRGREGGSAAVPPTARRSSGVPIHACRPETKVGAELGGPGGAFLLFPGSWRQVPRIKSDAGEVEGRGEPRGTIL